MELLMLGSSSNGNGYIIHNETEALLIEAGIRFSEVKRVLGFNISKITGCIISHEHGDHAKYIEDYVHAGIPVYASQGTITGCKWKKDLRPHVITHGHQFKAGTGNFKILPFDVQHDCNQPFGFLVYHPEMGKLLFLTDTFYSDYVFSGLNHILVEANYAEHILDENIRAGKVHIAQRNRLLTSHMSLNTCKELLKANDLSKVVNIVLIHLSDKNSNKTMFLNDIESLTGKPVFIAEKGLKLNLNKEGF
jgi:phosphoribosyl 1,2-cyclic phosphodiesterase